MLMAQHLDPGICNLGLDEVARILGTRIVDTVDCGDLGPDASDYSGYVAAHAVAGNDYRDARLLKADCCVERQWKPT